MFQSSCLELAMPPKVSLIEILNHHVNVFFHFLYFKFVSNQLFHFLFPSFLSLQETGISFYVGMQQQQYFNSGPAKAYS